MCHVYTAGPQEARYITHGDGPVAIRQDGVAAEWRPPRLPSG
jgi:hypothetical protein